MFHVKHSPKTRENKNNKDVYKRQVYTTGTDLGNAFSGGLYNYAESESCLLYTSSLNKRVKFLNTVIETLGLTGIRAIHGRAEDYARQADYRERFDLCVSLSLIHILRKTRKPVVLEPMNPYERRIIHSALQGNKYVETYSEGNEPYRHVVVVYKGK